MALVGVLVVLVRRAGPLQRIDQLEGFTSRHPRIVRALEHEERRADLARVRDRRAVAIQRRVRGRIAELADEVLTQVATCGVEQRLPGDDTDVRDAGREPVGMLREREQGHVAAVAAAADPDALRIRDALVDEPVDAGDHVGQIRPAPVTPVGLLELAAVARRATDVRREHDQPAVGEELRRRIPLPVVLGRGSAVDVHDRAG